MRANYYSNVMYMKKHVKEPTKKEAYISEVKKVKLMDPKKLPKIMSVIEQRKGLLKELQASA